MSIAIRIAIAFAAVIVSATSRIKAGSGLWGSAHEWDELRSLFPF